MFRNLFISVVLGFFFLLSANLNSTEITVGEEEPCLELRPGCPWDGPYLMPIYFDDCPDCPVLVEFYKRECGGVTYELQIVRLYAGNPGYSQTHYGCYSCTKIHTNEAFREAYLKIFDIMTKIDGVDDGAYEYIVEQKSCSKWVGPSLTDFLTPSFVPPVMTLTIPAGVLLNPFSLPDYQEDVAQDVSIFGYRKVCNTECCCFELEPYWNTEGELQAIYTGDPCANVSYDCPEGCSGGCNTLEFSWIKGIGFLKQSINFENTVESDIDLIPNPNNGTFKFNISNDEIGDLNLKIVDITGQTIYNNIIRKSDNLFSTNIALEVSTGEYFAIVTINNKFAGYHKIVITK